MLRVIIFAILTAALAYVSRASLKAPRSHGFYRFFAWECILALFFLNFISFQQWFGDPISVRQLISWILLIGCFIPGVYGLHLLRTQGRPDAHRSDDAPLVWIEKTNSTGDDWHVQAHPPSALQLAASSFMGRVLQASILCFGWGGVGCDGLSAGNSEG